MFAIIRTGGKQYKVEPNDVLFVERIVSPIGESITLETVLMVGQGDKTVVGHPYLQGALVKATVLDQNRADKIIIFKKKRRHTYRRKKGHRQEQTVLRITEIQGPNGLSAKAEIKKTPPAKKEATTLVKQEEIPKKGTTSKKTEKVASTVEKKTSAPKKA